MHARKHGLKNSPSWLNVHQLNQNSLRQNGRIPNAARTIDCWITTDNARQGDDTEGTRNDVQGSEHDIQGTERDMQGTGCDVQGTEDHIKGSECDIQGTEKDFQGSECDVQGTEKDKSFATTTVFPAFWREIVILAETREVAAPARRCSPGPRSADDARVCDLRVAQTPKGLLVRRAKCFFATVRAARHLAL